MFRFRSPLSFLPSRVQSSSGRRRSESRKGRRSKQSVVERLEDRTLLTEMTVSLTPVIDNTIFSENTNSAGAATGIYAGQTNQGDQRRGLLSFDVANAGIPNGATITGVTLSLHVSQGSGSHSFDVHRLTSDWGEGTSGGGGTGGGQGSAPTTDSATWQHTFFSGSTWSTAGGDFVSTASASTTVGGVGTYDWTSQGLIDDVNIWLATPSSNFGWILVGDETANRTARRFDSRESTVPTNRPTLSVTYDDGITQPNMSIANGTIVEGDSGVTTLDFDVTLSSASASTVTVDYATANDTATTADGDYVSTSSVLTFDPGVTTQTISVEINGDMKFEPDERFFVNLSAPQGASITNNQATGTITNDDPLPAITVHDVVRAEGSTGASSDFAFNLTLSNASHQEVRVNYSTSDDTATVADGDYSHTTGTAVFSPGDVTQQVLVPVTGDTKFEFDEFFDLILSSPNNATINDSLGTATVTNDDTRPAISIDDVAVAEGDAGTTTFTFLATLSNASDEQVSVSYATSPGTATAADFVADSGTITFAPGATTQTVDILVIGDERPESDETFEVNLASPGNGTIDDFTGIGIINNDDGPPNSIHGRKWKDRDADGIRSPSEPYLNGWTIELLNSNGAVVDTSVTMDIDLNDDDTIDPETETGWYWFRDMFDGSYTVREVLPSGWSQSAPVTGAYAAEVADGAVLNGLNFGNYRPGSIHGRKWEDINGNGRHDSDEPWLNGWTIELLDDQGAVIQTAVTHDIDLNNDSVIDPVLERGWYWFNDVDLGQEYTVREVLQAGWIQSAPRYVANLSPDNEISQTPIESSGVAAAWFSLDAVTRELAFEVTFDQLAGQVIGLHIHEGAAGVNGPVIHDLLAAAGLASPVSGNVARGVVTLSTDEITKLDSGELYINLHTDAFQPGELRDQIEPGSEHIVGLTSGAQIEGRDFGNLRPPAIHGRKWHDLDGNGQWDTGEPYLDGVTIELVNRATDEVVLSQLTHSGGWYWFRNLRPGDYFVREVSAAGTAISSPNFSALLRLEGQNGGQPPVHPATGTSSFSLDARGRLTFTVSTDGFASPATGVFLNESSGGPRLHDLGAAAGLDPSDPIPSVLRGVVKLSEGEIDQLLNGTLYVEVATAAPTESLTGRIEPGNQYSVTLTSGLELLDVDFGNYVPVSIHGRKWDDFNGDGIRIPAPVIDLGLVQHRGSFYENVFRGGEKWLRTANGDWYFLLPDGSLTAWDSTPGQLTGIVVAQLDPAVYVDPLLLIDAVLEPFVVETVVIELLNADGTVIGSTSPMDMDLNDDQQIDPETEHGWYWFSGLRPGEYSVREVVPEGWVQSVTPTHPLAATAYDLNSQLGLRIRGGLHLNFGDRGAKWFYGEVTGSWYFLTPSGELIEWDRASGTGGVPADGTLVATLNRHFYTRHELLIDAVDPAIRLLSGDTVDDADFANYRRIGIHGRKWNDLDADGLRMPQSIIDLQVSVHTSGSVFENAFRAEEKWLRAQLPDGSGGTVAGWVFILPDGQVTIWDGTAGTASGAAVAVVNRSFYDDPALLVSAQVEPWVNGVVIEAVDENGIVVATQTTHDMDVNGNGTIEPETERGHYWFSDLIPGAYNVREVLPAGWIQTVPGDGAELAQQLDDEFDVYSTGNLFENSHGLGEKWFRAALDGNRWYFILPNGDVIRWDRQSGIKTERPLSGDLVGTLPTSFHARPERLFDPVRTRFNLRGGDVYEGVDFANVQSVSIHGRVYDDVDGDGQRDANEPYVSDTDVFVQLLDQRTGASTSVNPQDVDLNNDSSIDPETEAGHYWFTNLLPGQYVVSAVQGSGGATGGPVTQPEGGQYLVTLSAGGRADNRDFGIQLAALTGPPSALDRVFSDALSLLAD